LIIVVHSPKIVGHFVIIRVVKARHPLNIVAHLMSEHPRVVNFKLVQVEMKIGVSNQAHDWITTMIETS
jgi:hypothetical protein